MLCKKISATPSTGFWRHVCAVLGLAGGLGLGASGAAAAAPPAAAEEKVLNVYNWSDYIAPDTIARFEKETGIKVNYDSFDSNEILHAKLVAGQSGYDIVVPSSGWAKVQIAGGLFQKLDKRLLPNLSNLDPAIQAQIGKLDPGNEYLVNWLWGYTTVGINVDKVKAALGDLPLPANVWDLVFKPQYMSRLKSCGVSFLDSASEVMPAAMHALGRNPYSKNPDDYQEALKMLQQVRPYVALFSSSGYINELANGSICVALGWSGDFNIARQRAQESRTGQNIEVLVPPSGGLLFFDTMAIPADAPHPKNAHLWINYILRPEVHASLTNKVFYANPNLASRVFVKPEVVSNRAIFLTPDLTARMVAPDAVPNNVRRAMTRLYTRFKNGV